MSTPKISALLNNQGQSKLDELYPPIILGFISSIISKNSYIASISASGVSSISITFSKPLLSFIPIMNILPSSGFRDVVSKSKTNL